LDDEIAKSDADSANMFNRYFHSVFSDSTELSSVVNYLEPTDHIDSISITVEEVYDALISFDPTKAPGIDLISPKFFRNVHQICFSHCTIFFQRSLHSFKLEIVPTLKPVTELKSRTTDLFHCSPVYP